MTKAPPDSCEYKILSAVENFNATLLVNEDLYMQLMFSILICIEHFFSTTSTTEWRARLRKGESD